MARSIISAKIVSLVTRRGYGSTSTETVKGSVAAAMMKKGGEESKKSTSWVPDPVTGYYKPEGHENQIDPAELRAMLLKPKTQRN
nr:hypothetical protein [Tanacetum cinerariifolium]